MHEVEQEDKPKKNGLISKMKRIRDLVAGSLIAWAITMTIITSMTESEISEKDYFELNRDLNSHPKAQKALPIAIKAAKDGKITYSERNEIYIPITEYDKEMTPGSRESTLKSLTPDK